MLVAGISPVATENRAKVRPWIAAIQRYVDIDLKMNIAIARALASDGWELVSANLRLNL